MSFVNNLNDQKDNTNGRRIVYNKIIQARIKQKQSQEINQQVNNQQIIQQPIEPPILEKDQNPFISKLQTTNIVVGIIQRSRTKDQPNQQLQLNQIENSSKLEINKNSDQIIDQIPLNTGINIKETELQIIVGCKCTKSNCLRMYCTCFKLQGYCNDNCRCINCLNTKEYADTRSYVIEKTKFIQQDAFSSKLVEINNRKFFQHGCICKQNCLKRYCACKRNNVQCSNMCQCQSCCNEKVNLSQKDIDKHWKRRKRRKDKLLINYKDGDDSNKTLTFQKIHRKVDIKK